MTNTLDADAATAKPDPEPTRVKRWIVGLTGGIGSGKSTVAACFQEKGITVIDTDDIAHRITAAGGVAMPAIISSFGDDVATPDGALDRQRMREIVFEDPRQRKKLESILHPMIREISEREISLAASAYVLLAIPLLIESDHPRERVQHILVVDCPEAIQIARVMKRSGLSEERVKSIMAAQATREQRLAQ
ncbi:MAG: dephospho-CoA kinase, partial [Betaproteobacteria bacterium]